MGGEEVSVAVCEDGEVVPFYVHEGKDDVFPAINEEELEVLLGAVLVDCVGCVDERKEDVVKEGLEGRDGSAFVD